MEIEYADKQKIVTHHSGRVDRYSLDVLKSHRDKVSEKVQRMNDILTGMDFEIAELSK